MASVWDKMAIAANKSPQQVQQEAALAWMGQEVTETDRAILAYIQQYRMTSPERLQEAIHSETEKGIRHGKT